MIHITGAHVSGDMLYLYVSITDPTTGGAADASAGPDYRVYIGENGTAVATGSMSKLDDANTLGFYSEGISLAGYDPGTYAVYITATAGGVAGATATSFRVAGAGALLLRTTIATLASQASFTLTAGPAENNALKNCTVIIRDAASVDQFAVGFISAYTGATKTVTLVGDPGIFTMAVGDFVEVLAPIGAKLVDGVTHGGETALLRLGSSTSTPAFYATNSDGAAVNFEVTAGNGSGLILSGSGTEKGLMIFNDAQFNLTGNISGNLSGSIGSVASGGITATSIAANAIGASELAADAATEIATAVWASATRLLTAGTNIVLAKDTGVTGFNDLSAAQVNAEVLDVLNVDALIDGKTFVQAVQYVSAITAGRVSGAGTGTEVFKGLDEATTRVTVTVDGSGNRTDIVYG